MIQPGSNHHQLRNLGNKYGLLANLDPQGSSASVLHLLVHRRLCGTHLLQFLGGGVPSALTCIAVRPQQPARKKSLNHEENAGKLGIWPCQNKGYLGISPVNPSVGWTTRPAQGIWQSTFTLSKQHTFSSSLSESGQWVTMWCLKEGQFRALDSLKVCAMPTHCIPSASWSSTVYVNMCIYIYIYI